MRKLFQKSSVALIGIFLLALLFRLVNLTTIPNALHVDELQAGYQGIKILTTGKDVFGNVLPVYLNRIGDYRPGGILYLVGISELIFGVNTFAVRFPVALLGALTVFPVYFLTNVLSKKKIIALLAAILLAISPWHIVASRATSESIVALFLTITGFSLLVYGLQLKKNKYFFLSGLSLLASYFFYHNPRIFIPAMMITITAIVYLYPQCMGKDKQAVQKPLIWLCFIIVVISTAIAFTKFGTGRFNETSIFASKEVKQEIKILNDGEHGNVLNARIFNNKPVVYIKTFVDQYISYFSTEYLFTRGGLPDRYVVDNMGLFYYIELPFILFGLYAVFKLKQPFFFIPLVWLVCGPLSAAITLEDSPNIQRSIFMLPSLQIIEAYGLYYSLTLCKPWFKKIAIGGIILLFITNGIYFFHMYFIHSPSHISFMRNDGNQALFGFLKGQENQYDRIYVTFGEDLPLYYLFMNSSKKPSTLEVPFDAYQAKPIIVGKYMFVHTDCPGENELKHDVNPKQKLLFVESGNCPLTSALSLLTTIYRKDDSAAYRIRKN